MSQTKIRPATPSDVPLILEFIRALAEYEKLPHEVEATVETLRATLFPNEGHAVAYCILAFEGDAPAGFAIYFYNYSTWLARPSASARKSRSSFIAARAKKCRRTKPNSRKRWRKACS